MYLNSIKAPLSGAFLFYNTSPVVLSLEIISLVGGSSTLVITNLHIFLQESIFGECVKVFL